MEIDEQLARLDERMKADIQRLNAFETHVEARLSNIENKLDGLLWKVALIVGALTGASQLAGHFLT